MSLTSITFRALGWACLACAIFIAIAWLASTRYGAAHTARGGPGGISVYSWSLAAGWIEYNDLRASPLVNARVGWEFWLRDRGPVWRWDYLHSTTLAHTVIGIPLWPAPPALALLGALLLRFTRPPPFRHCAVCGYDLRGLPADAPCPECGTPARRAPRDPAEPFLPVPGTNPTSTINSSPHIPPQAPKPN